MMRFSYTEDSCAMWRCVFEKLKNRFGLCRTACVFLVMVLCIPSMSAFAVEFCGSLERRQGPWDYTNPQDQSMLALVEEFHFRNDVFMLRGSLNGLTNNLSYTLGRFPNHHRALDALSRLAVREGTNQPGTAEYSINCYFERAMRWRPRDVGVRLVHAIHHYRSGRVDEAIAEAREGLKLAPNSAELHYNLGLFLVKKGDYAAARRHAQQAYRQNYPLPGLRQQLERVGQWSN